MAHEASVTPATTTQAIGAVRKGLPTGKLTQMAQLLAVDRALLLHILGVSQRTIQRKHVLSERLSPAASDRLSRIDRIYTLAVEVFRSAGRSFCISWVFPSGPFSASMCSRNGSARLLRIVSPGSIESTRWLSRYSATAKRPPNG